MGTPATLVEQSASPRSGLKTTGDIMNKYIGRLQTAPNSRKLDYKTPVLPTSMDVRKSQALRDAEDVFREKLHRARTLAAAANRERLTAEAKLAAVLQDNDLLRSEMNDVKEVNSLLENLNASLRKDVDELRQEAQRSKSPHRRRKAKQAVSSDLGVRLPAPPRGSDSAISEEVKAWLEDVQDEYEAAIMRLERAELSHLNTSHDFSEEVTKLRRKEIELRSAANDVRTPGSVQARPVAITPGTETRAAGNFSHPFGGNPSDDVSASPMASPTLANRAAEPPPVCCSVQ